MNSISLSVATSKRRQNNIFKKKENSLKYFSPLKAESAGLITNYRCTFKCDHCLYCSSPAIDEKIDDDLLKELIRQMGRALGIIPLHIGGGEPMLYFERIRSLLENLRKTRLMVEYIETNGSLLINHRREKLTALKNAGLNCLLLSISPFHNAFFPYGRIKEIAYEIVRTFGRRGLFPWHTGYLPFLERLSPDKTICSNEYFDAFSAEEIRYQLTSVMYIHPGGRAARFLAKHLPLYPIEELFKKDCHASLSSPVHAHLDFEGDYLAGFCSGLRLGEGEGFSLESLYAKGVSLDRYPILDILINQGVRGLYEYGLKAGYTPLGKGYVSPCHLCLDIRIHLYFHEAKYSELYPHFFYENLGPI